MSYLPDLDDLSSVVVEKDSLGDGSRDHWISFFLALAIANGVREKLDPKFQNIDSILRERISRSVEQWEW